MENKKEYKEFLAETLQKGKDCKLLVASLLEKKEKIREIDEKILKLQYERNYLLLDKEEIESCINKIQRDTEMIKEVESLKRLVKFTKSFTKDE